MQYRKFGSTDFKVSALGFGAMRLPVIGGDESKIDEPLAIKMIRYAIDNGVNYVDTAYGYHRGNSEIVVGKALKDGYRDKTRLATKLPVWLVNTREDMDRLLNEQLKKLDTDHIDFYLLHALNKNSWDKVYNLGVLDWAESVIKKGLIRYIGFSFHDDLGTFKRIVDAYNWTFCQIQYNYMDIDNQAGMEGLKYAHSKGLAVVIMEPLRGGRLANPPERVVDVFNSTNIKRSPVAWALLWLWNQPEVSTVLSGMSTFEQVKENVEIASQSGINIFTNEELQTIQRVRDTYLGIKAIDCTQCGYCMPCPNGVDIPRNFALYNEGVRYNDFGGPRWQYLNDLKAEERASSCIKCGECETKCPQGLPIRDLLDMVKARFEEATT
jgi:predicted aldo/keto reductase-like oxidoreductase